ncbi:PEGA domain-containing protein [Myxococcota bacterium]|nr:PEGA domain-containing protein [Myxococcota bacterium]
MSPTGSSASTGSSAASGLPLAVGDRQGPKPVVDLRARAAPEVATTPAWRRALPVVLTLGAVGVVGFTAWRLWGGPGEGGAQVPAAAEVAGPLSLLAQEGALPGDAEPARPPAGGEGTAAPDSTDAPPAPVAPAPVPAAPAPKAAPAPSRGGTISLSPGGATPSPAASPDATDGAGAGATGATVALGGPEADGAAAASPAPDAGLSVTISSEPRAAVVVDQVPRGQTPLMGLALAAGRHAVTLETPDGRRSTFTIDVVEGRRNTWVYDFETRSFR